MREQRVLALAIERLQRLPKVVRVLRQHRPPCLMPLVFGGEVTLAKDLHRRVAASGTAVQVAIAERDWLSREGYAPEYRPRQRMARFERVDAHNRYRLH